MHRRRRGFPHSERTVTFTDACVTSCRNLLRFSSGEVSSVGAGGKRRRARGREAGRLARVLTTVLRPGKADVFCPGRGFPGEQGGALAHFDAKAVLAARKLECCERHEPSVMWWSRRRR